MLLQNDEETPLLDSQVKKTNRTPLPWFQLSIILFLQLAEPLTAQVIYPFAPALIRDVGVTHGDEARVGYYVGIMQSLFFATQAMTVLHWSRLSDVVGRKPVLLIGLFGLSLSMYCFGLSKTFRGLVISRCLNGALNGNIGVLKSLVSEITDSTNLAQAYAFLPIAWSTGGILGPLIGGLLSKPAERFPNRFGHSDFLKKYPYFLPCAVPATFSLVAWFVTFLLLKETVPSTFSAPRFLKFGNHDISSKGSYSPSVSSLDTSEDDTNNDEKPYTITALLMPRVMIAAINYASLSLVDISFRAIQPLFFSTPVHLGGLGLPPPTIGTILSCFGILSGLLSVLFFAKIHDRWGTKRVFIAGIASAIPVFAAFPILNAMARAQGLSTAVWLGIAVQVTFSSFLNLSYGCIFIYIAAASPNRASLGGTNGICQCLVSTTRAFGPAIANSLFSLSMEKGYLGGSLVYYVLVGVVCMALTLATFLPRRLWNA
jgi:MFS family permease